MTTSPGLHNNVNQLTIVWGHTCQRVCCSLCNRPVRRTQYSYIPADIFTDETNGTVIAKMSYVGNCADVSEEDISVVSLPVVSNKPYHIELSASAQVALVIVVKAYQRPVLEDFYGGERISPNTILLVVDFTGTSLPMKLDTDTTIGLKNVTEDVNNTRVSLFGRLHNNDETVMLYFGLMPAVYDAILCDQCLERSKRECGFCSGKKGTSTEAELDVNVTIARHVTKECVYWNNQDDKWITDGCEVNVFDCHVTLVRSCVCSCVRACVRVYVCMCVCKHRLLVYVGLCERI